jgi:Golgi SNAP receptor complex protein 1
MLNTNTSETMYETLSMEIEQLLKKLNQVNNKMNDCLDYANSQQASTTNQDHTLQRHREILRDYTQEFEKTKRNILSIREREKLLSLTTTSKLDKMNNMGLNNRTAANNNNSSTSLYLKEFDHLKR